MYLPSTVLELGELDRIVHFSLKPQLTHHFLSLSLSQNQNRTVIPNTTKKSSVYVLGKTEHVRKTYLISRVTFLDSIRYFCFSVSHSKPETDFSSLFAQQFSPLFSHLRYKQTKSTFHLKCVTIEEVEKLS